MVDAAIEQAKAALRTQAHALRAAMQQPDRAAAAEAVAEHLFVHLTPQQGEIVAAYWALRDELDCQPILVRLLAAGNRVVLPAVVGQSEPLDMRVWEPGAALYEAGFGTLAPSPLAPRAMPDIVLMPLLGFDETGTRLGYGGGYYDRTLASWPKRPKLVGLAFAAQEFALIPRELHDIPLDAVITETGIRHFGPAA
jgi:5-formyltetrahydrofolate cyclo-ligase